MNNFRTEVSIQKSNVELNHNRPILSFGSCFAFEIFKKLRNYGFHTQHPGGVMYNPISILDIMHKGLNNIPYVHTDLVRYRNTYFSWFHNGKDYHEASSEKLIHQLNDENVVVKELLKNKPIILITFGTAYIYELQSTSQIVANCHKQNSALFNKRKLTVEEITTPWKNLIQHLDAEFIFTVSPVRHLKDGLVENNVSKSTLILAVEEIISAFPDKSTYFPSYELLLDELRDYRFYASDWIHPSTEAIDYIWEKFSRSFMADSSQALILEIEKIRKGLNHKILYEIDTDFYKKLLKKIELVKPKTPHYAWEHEIAFVQKYLAD
jgi:hypothetical protein